MLGIIGGGNMGEALLKGLINSKIYKSKDIIIFEIDKSRANFLKKRYDIQVAKNNNELIEKCSMIILAIKPQVISKVLNQIKNTITNKHIIISIAAGITISQLENYIGKDKKIIRVMPNTPAFVQQSMSAICINKKITKKDLIKAVAIFDAIGKTIIVEENQMNAITAVSGSGPGYIGVILEAFSDAAVNVGLPRNIARELIMQTFKGTIELIEKNEISFSDLKNMVTSPGGTTISGIYELEKSNFRGAIMSCIKSSYEKGIELSSEIKK